MESAVLSQDGLFSYIRGKRKTAMRRIIYDGDSFYELDEDCVKKQKEREKKGKQDQESAPRPPKEGRR